jgi:hypothetical protein
MNIWIVQYQTASTLIISFPSGGFFHPSLDLGLSRFTNVL